MIVAHPYSLLLWPFGACTIFLSWTDFETHALASIIILSLAKQNQILYWALGYKVPSEKKWKMFKKKCGLKNFLHKNELTT